MDDGFGVFIFVIIMCIVIFFAGGIAMHPEKTYKDGQIDAMSGKIVYEKVVTADNSVHYIKLSK